MPNNSVEKQLLHHSLVQDQTTYNKACENPSHKYM